MDTHLLKTKVIYSNLEQFINNHQFECKIWKNTEAPAKQVVIMFNGFLEGIGNRNSAYLRYKKIGEELNNKGITAILLPLPFHFGRSVVGDGKETVSPISRLKIHGSFLYHGGFTQIKADVEVLYQELKNEPSRFNLKEDFVVSLLGYSIGGISAIAAAKHLQEKLDLKLNSLILLLSAWKIQDIDASSVAGFFRHTEPDLNEETWTTMMRELETIRHLESTDAIFKELVWGEDIGSNPELKFDEIAEKVLFIDGQMDEIFTQNIIRQRRDTLLEQNLRNCTFLSLPLQHAAMSSSGLQTPPKYISMFCSL
jgi:pimeloyl-ACP methyl ester carboxylesterase